MKRRKNKKENNRLKNKNEEKLYPILTSRLKRWIATISFIFLSLLIILSIFGQAGKAGDFLYFLLNKIFGNVVYFLPFFLIFAGFLFLNYQRKRIFAPTFIGFLLIIIGLCGIFSLLSFERKLGGWVGYLAALPIVNFFGTTVTKIVFFTLILTGSIIIWEFTPKAIVVKEEPNKQIIDLKEQRAKQQLQSVTPKNKVEIHPISFLAGKKELFIKKANENIQKKTEEEEYKIPPASLFDLTQEKPQSLDIQNKSFIIQKTLENFGIPVEMKDVNVGPTVTQYTLKPAEGVKLSKIVSLANDLALALAAHSVRIEAPIPGKSLVGIEIPNNQRAKIKLGFLLLKDEFLKSKNKLEFALGTDVVGNPIYLNIEDMPHLLVAGSTGSGKTICLNSIIISLIYRNSPKDLRLVLVDPKRVEFVVYNELPHLLTPVILDAKSALLCLSWVLQEMERRFEILQDSNCRDIIAYNKKIQETSKMQKEGFEKMPYIVVVIDELADLMAAKGKEIENIIVRLAQLARAVGIHLILATQRPSVEVITGLIKANITSRIAFQVASQIDSRTILDTSGAEKLLGKGDLLFQTSQFARPKRAQGAFISSDEIRKIVKFIQKENSFEDLPFVQLQDIKNVVQGEGEILDEDDPLYEEAKKTVIFYQKASASLLQRKLKIGYARAARLLDILEERGVIGPSLGAKPREVYIKAETSQNFDFFPQEEEKGQLSENDTEKNEDDWVKL